MKIKLFVIAAIISLFVLWRLFATESPIEMLYDTPAAEWKESLPIGNGRMGTMVGGAVSIDTLVINEDCIWSGAIHDYSNPQAFAHLEEIRECILNRDYAEALAIGDKYMIGTPRGQNRYQPLGDLIFSFDQPADIKDYSRVLNLSDAVVSVSYVSGGANYRRDYFASYPDDVIVMRFTTDSDAGLNFTVHHTSSHNFTATSRGDGFSLSGSTEAGADNIHFASRLKVIKGAERATADGDGIRIAGAREVVLLYTAETNFVDYDDLSNDPEALCEAIIAKAEDKSYKQLLKQHTQDHKELFDRVSLDLDAKSGSATIPQMLESVAAGGVSRELDEKFYQFARYLTIAGSREGSQPLNLQGIWNNNMSPNWGSKWTLNINLPMNYWGVESSNLSQTHQPLFDLLEGLHETGAKVARTHYGCRGFVAHHNTDLWRGAAPVDGANWGLWTQGGAWLTRHILEHYEYTLDESFLEKYYPIMKDASLFFFDFLSRGGDEYLVTSPAVSFEQSYRRADGQDGRLCEGPTMDNQILRDLFNNCIAAAIAVDDDESYIDSLKYFRDQLRPTTIDPKSGELMEWAWEAYPNKVSGQLAPLWGVNPGTEINIYNTPELSEAAVRTILARDPQLPPYETSGSWISGTRTNFWARLCDGDRAYGEYIKALNEKVIPNLFMSIYNEKHFQIDGNFGIASAFNEMLLQSHRKDDSGVVILDILPALPASWPSGQISGICARGGFELDITWREGAAQKVVVRSTGGQKFIVKCGDAVEKIVIKPGSEVTLCL